MSEEQLEMVNESATAAVARSEFTHKVVQVACVALAYIGFVITFAISLTWIQAIGLYLSLFVVTFVFRFHASAVADHRGSTSGEKAVFWGVCAVIAFPFVFRAEASPTTFASAFAMLPTSVYVVYMVLRWRSRRQVGVR
ncbi:hypothetical protein [Haloglycomyces albus]|uniref:hypothetical protein n=1 Tax=Haloglycomyces albus TaxID=526067 RepID=UPI000551E471|nr:hypothetical protein [Haloglycomyces albus]